MNDIVRYGFTLGAICFLASGVLATVNGITEPKIKQQKEAAQTAALQEVSPEAQRFAPRLENDAGEYYVAYDSGSNIIGFVFTAQAKGYSSTIELCVGVNRDLQITDVKVLSQNETPGLGTRVTEPEFRDQFKGKTLETYGQVQAITGATISSSAVIGAVKEKLSLLKDTLHKELDNDR